MPKRLLKILFIGGILMLTLSGCFLKSYKVNYEPGKDSFSGAKDSYRAGATVTLYYSFIATDTDYYFYVDGERVNPDYTDGRGYKLEFTMPEHDVSVRVESKNTMVYVPENDKTAVLSFDSFDGGGPAYTVKVEDASVVTYDRTKKYHNVDHDYMGGAGFTVNITFFGLKPGTTAVTVECRSPIAENFDAFYDVTVDENLNVTLTEREVKEIAE